MDQGNTNRYTITNHWFHGKLSGLRHPYVWYVSFASISGFLFGFDTGSIGPVTVMAEFKKQFDPISSTLHGLIVSSILIPAACASLAGGHLSDHISRTRTFAFGAAIFAAGSVIECTSFSLAQLFVGRCLAGIGEGLFYSTSSVYIMEIAPSSIRARLSCIMQLFTTIGIATGYFVCYGTTHINSSLQWRLPFICQVVVASIYSIGSHFLPHSPRWLRHVGRDDEARVAWAKLGFSPTESEKEMETVQRDEVTDARLASERSGWKTVVKNLMARDARKQALLAAFIMGMQQASGIDGVLYYAPVLFTQAGLSSTEASFLASGVSALLNIAVTIFALMYAEKWGRRTTTITGGSAIATTMLLIGSIYASHLNNTRGGRYAIIGLIYIFVVAFGLTWAIVCRTYCTEIQPMKTRAAASSLAQFSNWSVNWTVAFSTPILLARSSFGAYFLFGGCALLTAFVCLAFQPESRGMSLEEVGTLFDVSPWRKIVSQRSSFIGGFARRQRQNIGTNEEIELNDLLATMPVLSHAAPVQLPIS